MLFCMIAAHSVARFFIASTALVGLKKPVFLKRGSSSLASNTTHHNPIFICYHIIALSNGSPELDTPLCRPYCHAGPCNALAQMRCSRIQVLRTQHTSLPFRTEDSLRLALSLSFGTHLPVTAAKSVSSSLLISLLSYPLSHYLQQSNISHQTTLS